MYMYFNKKYSNERGWRGGFLLKNIHFNKYYFYYCEKGSASLNWV